eukprot:CAMPEP_0206444744 /NCGR_PEP_ID=MMETSP0324_2-20121206/15087_1 /ASSEMBLY_ACC=CAM_ASM_000836 /TAXON_ID=2866 /ORGANISM="Crypthecodinium cohnii, Strain Seligo" /LENGTH=354 /DNA_ID=CAMNT_0053912811 /DNA_START=95 /DNA_END=1159 /DNA_ORIENTATION=+
MSSVPPGTGLVVKNTFLEFDEAPPAFPGELSRAKTHTGVVDHSASLSDDEEDVPAPYAPAEPSVPEEASTLGSLDHDLDSDSDAPPPGPSELCRYQTGDNYQIDRVENNQHWAASMPPAGPGGVPAQGGVFYMMSPFPPPMMIPGQSGPGMMPAPQAPPPDLGRVITPGDPPPSSALASGQEVPAPIDFAQMSEVPVRPVLQRNCSTTRPFLHRITWRVDERKLKSTDREHVSPMFLVHFANKDVQFKIVIQPKATNEQRGGASFKKAKGKGYVELRCLERLDAASSPKVHFSIAVHPDPEPSPSDFVPPDGVIHDFSTKSIAGLPRDIDETDFGKAVKDSVFYVCVKINSAPQ